LDSPHVGEIFMPSFKEVHGIEEGNFQKNIVILQILGRFICNWKYDSKNFG